MIDLTESKLYEKLRVYTKHRVTCPSRFVSGGSCFTCFYGALFVLAFSAYCKVLDGYVSVGGLLC